jgi:PAS domain S-box-containing protein
MNWGLRRLKLGSKLSALAALAVMLAVLALGLNFESMLRQSFLDNTLGQMHHAFQRLDINLEKISSSLKEGARLAGNEESLIASIELINQYQNKTRYNTILIDEEKKSLAKMALDRVKFSQSHDVAIYDQHNELLAFASRQVDGYQLGYRSFAAGHAQTLVRPELETEFVPVTNKFGHLLAANHIALTDAERSSQEQLVSYQRMNNDLVVKSHKNVFDSSAQRYIGHVEFAFVIDSEYFSSFSKDIGFKMTQAFARPLAAQTTELNRLTNVTALTVMESDQEYLAVVHKGTVDGPVFFTVSLDKDHEHELINNQRRQLLLVLLAVGGGLLLVMRQIFGRILEYPLKQLMNQIDQIKRGNYDVVQAPKTGDELDEVGRSITALAGSLRLREAELRESEQKTQVLATSLQEAQTISQLGSWTLDLSRNYLVWSAEIYRLFELELKQFEPTYESFLNAVHPDDRSMVHQAYQDSLVHHTNYKIEHRLLMPDGRIKWVTERCRTDFEPDGIAIRSIGTVQDITERKLAELALTESHSLLMAVIDAIPMRVFWKDEKLKYLGCNTAFALDAGKNTPDELIGKDDFQMSWAAQAILYRADDRDLLATGIAKLGYEEPQTTPDGQSIWLRTSKIPLRNQGGHVFGVLGIYEDITQSKQSEELVRKLSQVAEQSPESVLITDLNANIEYVNGAYLRNSGYSRAEVIGKNPREFQANLNPKSTYLTMWQSLQNGNTWSGELYSRRKDGSQYTEWAVTSPLRNAQGVITHYVSIQEDITEKNRLAEELQEYRQGLELMVKQRTLELTCARQQADESNRAKSEFLANMSHEIRTPLGAISGMAKLIRKEPLTLSQTDKLKKLESAAQHLSATINDILDLSKIEANKLLLEEQPLSIATIFDNISNMLRESAQEKGLSLQVEVDPMPSGLVGDATRLGQALLNYASNAVKFTDTGSVTLRGKIQEDTADSTLLRLEVQDTGVGISQEKLTKLFTAFVQADSTTARKYGGTGLGLVIAKRLAEAMGGEVGAASAVGEGSTFWLTARLKKGAPINHEDLNEFDIDAAEQLRLSFAGRRVLLAEDDDFLREIGTILLQDVGLIVEVAEDGQVAFDLARKFAYDLILMDMQMPRMNGLEATRQIRNTGTGKSTPIVAMTANAFSEDRTRCIEAGMNDFLTKPVDPNVFYKVLLSQLEKTR